MPTRVIRRGNGLLPGRLTDIPEEADTEKHRGGMDEMRADEVFIRVITIAVFIVLFYVVPRAIRNASEKKRNEAEEAEKQSGAEKE